MLPSLLTAMATILLSWLVLIPLLTGIGLLLQRFCGLHAHSFDLTFLAFWIGLAATLALLQMVHLLLPIQWPTSSALGLLGLLGLVVTVPTWRHTLPRFLAQHRVALFLTLVLAVWVANVCLQYPEAYDSGLYHLQAVKWTETYPVVPGLTNLHFRFGFNNASWLYYAALDALLPNHAAHFAASALVVVLLAHVLLSGSRMLQRQESPRSFAGTLMLLPLYLLWHFGHWMHQWSSFTADLPAAAFACVATLSFFRFLGTDVPSLPLPTPQPAPSTRSYFALAAITLAAAAITVKLTMLILAAFIILGTFVLWFRHVRPRWPRILGLLVLPTFLLVPWIFRNYILSGYPLYPSTLAGLPLPWRFPAARAIALQHLITEWARLPMVDPSTAQPFAWIPPWFSRTLRLNLIELYLPLALGLLFLALAVGRRLRASPTTENSKRKNPLSLWLSIPALLIALLFWFIQAPDPRFGFFLAWLLTAAALPLLIGDHDSRRLRFTLAAFVPVLFLLALSQDLLLQFREASSSFSLRDAVTRTFFVPPGPDHGFYPAPTPPLQQVMTASGLILHVPLTGDQAWDAPLPSTPYPEPALSLRHPPDLSAGFILQTPPPQP